MKRNVVRLDELGPLTDIDTSHRGLVVLRFACGSYIDITPRRFWRLSRTSVAITQPTRLSSSEGSGDV